jgi:DNA-directed RNA polymerase specialized sigma24 family protein
MRIKLAVGGNTMGNQGCSDILVEDTAARLFQTAALLLGDGDEAVRLVEETMAGAEVDPCADGSQATAVLQNQLVQAAIRELSQREPGSFAAAETGGGNALCIDDDDLSASGITSSQLSQLLLGEGRSQLRDWLEHLPPAQRAVFVERAMLGQDNTATAQTLRTAGGETAAGWTPDKVSNVFRQALCSLANSLAHSGALTV